MLRRSQDRHNARAVVDAMHRLVANVISQSRTTHTHSALVNGDYHSTDAILRRHRKRIDKVAYRFRRGTMRKGSKRNCMPLPRRKSKVGRQRNDTYYRKHKLYMKNVRARESVSANECRLRKQREYMYAQRAKQQHMRRESSANIKPRICKCTLCGNAGHNRRSCPQRDRVVYSPRTVAPTRRVASKEQQSRAPRDAYPVLYNRGRDESDQQSWVKGARKQHSLQTRIHCVRTHCM